MSGYEPSCWAVCRDEWFCAEDGDGCGGGDDDEFVVGRIATLCNGMQAMGARVDCRGCCEAAVIDSKLKSA